MSYPWLAQTVYNKAAVSEGLRIVRKVIARDAAKTGLTTKDLYKLALREPPLPSFGSKIPVEQEDFVPEVKYGRRTGRKRIPPPEPSHPRHPVRSISFLKQHILPIIQGERTVRHVREQRVAVHSQTDMKPRAVRGANQAAAMEATVWKWQASKPPPTLVKIAPAPRPVVYDCSHMKRSKRKAHKERLELAAKREVLQARREALKKEARRKAEAPILAAKRLESKARHEAAEKAGWAEKERRRKRWEEQNPLLARQLAKQQRAEAEQKAKPLEQSKTRHTA
ncbi:hypothetical protein C8R47DRAFT_448171 [Mycena vitilis]|nr:hypothetical protein C8R47DRAFT_448171 [Mycena vitilis]